MRSVLITYTNGDERRIEEAYDKDHTCKKIKGAGWSRRRALLDALNEGDMVEASYLLHPLHKTLESNMFWTWKGKKKIAAKDLDLVYEWISSKRMTPLEMKAKAAALWKKYEMNLADYFRHGDKIGWICEVPNCERQLIPFTRNIGSKNNIVPTTIDVACVDHNHKTGVIRGIVCSDCNLTMGQSREKMLRLFGICTYWMKRGNYDDETVEPAIQKDGAIPGRGKISK